MLHPQNLLFVRQDYVSYGMWKLTEIFQEQVQTKRLFAQASEIVCSIVRFAPTSIGISVQKIQWQHKPMWTTRQDLCDSPYLSNDVRAHDDLALGKSRGEELVSCDGRPVVEHVPHHLNTTWKTS